MDAACGYYENIGNDSVKVDFNSDFKIPPLGGEAIMNNEAVQSMLHDRTLLRPHVDSELGTACGTCIEQCPVSALFMDENIPEVDADTCITCFCCQEMCPEKAIALK
jgi:ferredoxin